MSHTLQILFCAADTQPEKWLDPMADALARHGLAAEVQAWSPADAWGAGEPQAVDYLLVWKPPPALFARYRAKGAVFNLGAGVDALLPLDGLPPDLPLYRLADAGMAEQMIDYALAAVLRRYRRLDEYAGRQSQARWEALPIGPKSAFGVGVLGLGALGRPVAEAIAARGFPVTGWSRSGARDGATPPAGVQVLSGPEGLKTVLQGSRMLICLLPLTPDTRCLLNRERLQQLPQGAAVVNMARGGLLVEDDLMALLDAGHLGPCTLDVTQREPLPARHPLWQHPNISLTPHVAAQTLRGQSIEQIADTIAALERGASPDHLPGWVDRTRHY